MLSFILEFLTKFMIDVIEYLFSGAYTLDAVDVVIAA